MKTINDFLNQFVETEYVLSKNRFDEKISNEDQEQMCYEKMVHFYHSTLRNTIDSYLRGKRDLSEKSLLIYKKPERVQHRLIFQIRKYESPTCGNAIKKLLKEDVIYLCYTGSSEIIEDNIAEYYHVYVVAETEEGLRIISYFRWDEGELEQLNDYKPSHITKLGKLVGVEKFLAPEEETSLADYNKD